MFEIFHEALWEGLADLLAVVYALGLAALISAMIFLSAVPDGGAPAPFWRQACGFVLLYIALGAAYMDPSAREISAHNRPGYIAGLASYLLFAAVPSLLQEPHLLSFHRLLAALAGGWIGWILSAVTVAEIVLGLARRGLGGVFFVLSPVLWRVGLQRYPPIRVRRRRRGGAADAAD